MLIKKSILAMGLSFLVSGAAFADGDTHSKGDEMRSDVAAAIEAGIDPTEVTPAASAGAPASPRVATTPAARRFTPRPPSRPGNGGGAGGGGGTASPN